MNASRRAWALAVLATFSIACGGDASKTPPGASAEHAASASAKESAAASAKPSAEASAPPSGAASAAPSAEASAAPSAAPSASPSGTASAAAKSEPSTFAAAIAPEAPSGVMRPGAADKLLKPGGDPIVKLLDAGEEPRSKLAYALEKGSAQDLDIAQETTAGMQVGVEKMPPTKAPRMSMRLKLDVRDKNEAGEAEVLAKLVKVSLETQGPADEAAAKQMKPLIDAMTGISWSYWMSSHGRVRDMKMEDARYKDAGTELLGLLTQSFESMAVLLPEEPVGLGAKWQVVTRVQSMGADILQLETFTLKKREATRASLDVSLTQIAASDSVHPPNMQPGAAAKVVAFKSSANGHTEFAAKRVGPNDASLRSRTLLEMSVKEAKGAAQNLRLETSLTVHYGNAK
ncbi:MAG TPA: hypothetical protein VGM56_02730 [Byssovorax sp.]